MPSTCACSIVYWRHDVEFARHDVDAQRQPVPCTCCRSAPPEICRRTHTSGWGMFNGAHIPRAGECSTARRPTGEGQVRPAEYGANLAARKDADAERRDADARLGVCVNIPRGSELEGNIRGNDYLMTFEELGSGFALMPPIPYQPVLLMRDNAGEILKVPVNDFEAYVRWGSPPERCLTTLVVDAWGNPAIRRQCSLLISP